MIKPLNRYRSTCAHVERQQIKKNSHQNQHPNKYSRNSSLPCIYDTRHSTAVSSATKNQYDWSRPVPSHIITRIYIYSINKEN